MYCVACGESIYLLRMSACLVSWRRTHRGRSKGRQQCQDVRIRSRLGAARCFRACPLLGHTVHGDDRTNSKLPRRPRLCKKGCPQLHRSTSSWKKAISLPQHVRTLPYSRLVTVWPLGVLSPGVPFAMLEISGDSESGSGR